MPSLPHYLLTQACNNAWSNHRLLRACLQLPDTDFSAARVSFFPSLRATLNHILTVDWYYVDALERSVCNMPPNPDAARFFDPEASFATCAPLAQAQRAVDQRLIDLCAGLTATSLAQQVQIPRSSGVQREPLTRLLAHLFQHQIHHRGQAHAMLAGTAVAPPQLDEFFCANEVHLRAQDFAELGFAEHTIWPPAT